MTKLFVLDTNVLLHDPRAIFKFDEHDIVLPIYVIEEIDKFKREMNELGRNARTISRLIDDLRKQASTNLQAGVQLPTGGTLRVVAPPKDPEGNADRRILQVALDQQALDTGRSVTLISMDINLRLLADALGLAAETYDDVGHRDLDELYTGIIHHKASQEIVDRLGKRQEIEASELGLELHPNACVVLENEQNPKHTALGRFNVQSGQLMPLRVPRDGVSGIKPRNLEQSFALDLLLDDKVQLVTLVGRAGTGKTLLAVAAGLRKVVSEGAHARLLVSRPVMPLGKDVGYLPGTLEEKLAPYMGAILDNLQYVFHGIGRTESGRSYEELFAQGTIQVEALTYIRGRSLPQQFLIVDEAQNLTPHELKTVITRAGEGTKIVLTGDPAQIDHALLDSQSNGLSVVAERFKPEAISGHITLTRGVRSELAERASLIL